MILGDGASGDWHRKYDNYEDFPLCHFLMKGNSESAGCHTRSTPERQEGMEIGCK